MREEMGYPPLVTPTSQIVGTQAALNVMVGERWKVIPKEVRQYFLGYYGRTPAPVDKEIQKKATDGEAPITCRPGEKIAPELEKLRKEVEAWVTQPEDVLSYAMFPQVAKDFLPKKFARVTCTNVGLDDPIAEGAYPV